MDSSREDTMRVKAQGPDALDACAVEGWLRRDLAARYGSVADETLPPDLLALLAEFA